jgi:hypothetical protein
VRLLTPGALDGRTRASKAFDSIISGIVSDLGGDAELTEIERHLVVSFAGSAIMQKHLITRLLAGEQVDVSEFSNNASSLIRGASRLGTHRRARTVAPTLQQYLSQTERT